MKTDAIKMLRRVKRLILAEPKRVAMGTWLTRKEDDSAYVPAKGFPKCGAVGCIGGWTEELYLRDHPRAKLKDAGKILGLDSPKRWELFYPLQLVESPNPQTASYARAVAAHIDAFIKKHSGKVPS